MHRLHAITFLLAGLGVCAPAAAQPAQLAVLPDELDLGERAPGKIVRTSVWLLNTGRETLELTGAKGSCGCTAIDFKPRALPPRAGMEVPVRVTAPKRPGLSKPVSITFTIKDRPPVRLPVRIATTGDLPWTGRAVRAEPQEIDLGPVTAGTTMSTSARLVNTGDAPMRVTAAKAPCPCLRAPDFTAFTLEPGEAADVQLDVDVPSRVGTAAVKEISFIVQGQAAVKVPLRMTVEHPLAETAKRHIDAIVSEAYRCDDFRVEGNVVTAILWEGDRAAPKSRVICRFNADGGVESTELVPIDVL